MLPVSLDCQFLIAPSVFSNVYSCCECLDCQFLIATSVFSNVYSCCQCLWIVHSWLPFGFLVVCSSLIYEFWLPPWYLQTLLIDNCICVWTPRYSWNSAEVGANHQSFNYTCLFHFYWCKRYGHWQHGQKKKYKGTNNDLRNMHIKLKIE
jgi:hypothetical protein